MQKENIALTKSFDLALQSISIFKLLTENKKEFIISKQLLKSATSVGANIEEAIGGSSARDFVAKLSISYKEARETRYWLRLLKKSGYLDTKQVSACLSQCEDLCRLLGKSISTVKRQTSKNDS